MTLKLILILILLFVVAMTVTTAVFPYVLGFAQRHNIVDHPGTRKLHDRPVPVLGGVAVYAGIFAGCLVMMLILGQTNLKWCFLALTTMLLMGVWDDRKNLSAMLRFVMELGIVGTYMGLSGHYIHNFYGLFGIHEVSDWVGIPLSVVSGVGIINAINMIDGIDGYFSGFVIMACVSFAAFFIAVGQTAWASLAVIVVATLIPFFIHNVFGTKTKMFIGDGGTMMLGFLITVFVFEVMSLNDAPRLEAQGIGLAAMTLSILCIPVFDTLRVMTARMMRRRSPFKPDKTHLHHLFIDMGFSHLGTTVVILSMNLIVVIVWLLLWQFGASINTQICVVVLMGGVMTFGFYKLMRWQQHSGHIGKNGCPQGTPLWHAFCRIGRLSHNNRG